MFAAMKQELFSDNGFGPLEPNSSSASASSQRAAAAAGSSTCLKIPQPRVSVIASSNPKWTGDFGANPSEASNCFSSVSSTTAASQSPQNRQGHATRGPLQDGTINQVIRDDFVHPIMKQNFCKSKKSQNASDEDMLQPNPLELSHKNQQASRATQDVTNATIRDFLTPTVLAQGPIEAQNGKNFTAQWDKKGKNPEKLRFLGDKSSLDLDSSQRAEANGDIREPVGSTVFEKKRASKLKICRTMDQKPVFPE